MEKGIIYLLIKEQVAFNICVLNINVTIVFVYITTLLISPSQKKKPT